LLTAALLVLLVTAGRAAGAEALITADELPPQSADGLHLKGVTFGFEQEGQGFGGAFFGDTGPGLGAFVQTPIISVVSQSGSGALVMEFDIPTPNLQFGVVVSTNQPLPEGATVVLVDEHEDLIDIIPLTTSVYYRYSEGLFNYSGPPVKFAVVYSEASSLFGVDNLRFGTLTPKSQASGEGIASGLGQRYAAVVSARATGLGRGTGFLYFLSAGNDRGAFRSVRMNTVMLFGNRAALTGTAVVAGFGTVPFAVEIVDNGRTGQDRITLEFLSNGGVVSFPSLPLTTGDIHVR
jgi:hypothetical protein